MQRSACYPAKSKVFHSNTPACGIQVCRLRHANAMRLPKCNHARLHRRQVVTRGVRIQYTCHCHADSEFQHASARQVYDAAALGIADPISVWKISSFSPKARLVCFSSIIKPQSFHSLVCVFTCRLPSAACSLSPARSTLDAHSQPTAPCQLQQSLYAQTSSSTSRDGSHSSLVVERE